MEDLPNEVLLGILSMLKYKDLLYCRHVCKGWDSLAIEVVKKKCPLVTLSTRMETLYFLQLIKNAPGQWMYNRIRLALNNIPNAVLEQFSEDFGKRNIKLTLFRQPENSETKICTKAQVLLQQMQGISYLKIEHGTKLLNDSDLPAKNHSFKFSSFQNLTTIVWNDVDKNLLLSILPKAPALRTLVVEHWFDSAKYDFLGDAPLVMENLPMNALLSTIIPTYCTQASPEVEHIIKMCRFENKISELMLQRFRISGRRRAVPNPDWQAAITQLLQSQNKSLKHLDIRCRLCFDVPKLDDLEFLRLGEVVEVEIDPNLFPCLKKLALIGKFWASEGFFTKVWTAVVYVELLFSDKTATPDGLFNNIDLSFPNLKILKINVYQFPDLVEFCRTNNVPAEELRVYATNCALRSSYWKEVWENIRQLVSQGFPSNASEAQGAKLGLLGLKTLRFFDVDENVLSFLDLASRLGIIKLHMLDVSLIDSICYQAYKDILCLYHYIVVIHNSRGSERRGVFV